MAASPVVQHDSPDDMSALPVQLMQDISSTNCYAVS